VSMVLPLFWGGFVENTGDLNFRVLWTGFLRSRIC
jgi:hypothetical protein